MSQLKQKKIIAIAAKYRFDIFKWWKLPCRAEIKKNLLAYVKSV